MSHYGKNTMSYVYFIRAGIYTKIGVAKNVKRRLDQIQTGNPVELKLECAIKMPNMISAFDLESKLHLAFMSKHKHGEWYFLKNAQIKKFIDEYMVNPNVASEFVEGCDLVRKRDTAKVKALRYKIKSLEGEVRRLRAGKNSL